MFKDPVIVKLPELSDDKEPVGPGDPAGPCKPTEYTLTIFAAILF